MLGRPPAAVTHSPAVRQCWSPAPDSASAHGSRLFSGSHHQLLHLASTSASKATDSAPKLGLECSRALHAPHALGPTPVVSRACLCMQAFAGIVTVSVGHCHPKVKAAVDEQNKRLQHTTPIYLNHQIAEYAKELTDRLPGNLKVSQGLVTPAGKGCCTAGCFSCGVLGCLSCTCVTLRTIIGVLAGP